MDKVTSIVKDIMEILPERLEDKQSGSDDAEPASLALVLAQEISMYNQLSDVMRSTLTDVLDSLKGIIFAIFHAIFTKYNDQASFKVLCLEVALIRAMCCCVLEHRQSDLDFSGMLRGASNGKPEKKIQTNSIKQM